MVMNCTFPVKDSFAFAKEIIHQDSKLFMGSLFTNIPLKETINICTNLLYNMIDDKGVNRSEFENLLSLATKEWYFMFNDILYKGHCGQRIALRTYYGECFFIVL